jgi:hypothetical protein
MSRPDDPKITADPVLHRVLDDVNRVHGDVERQRGDQVLNKEKLFSQLENGADGEPDRRLIAYIVGPGGGGIDLADAAPLGSMLDAIGTCDNLDLMINSPGGSGESAEKIIEMCRNHCSREFRVIVPNYAKSAATMIALGADVILMGYLSELGPIDPQYAISVGNVEQIVSGQSFLGAYEKLQQQVKDAEAAGESVLGYLTLLQASTMEPAFIQHCERGVDFARDVAEKFLPKYQLKALAKAKGESTRAADRNRAAKAIAENLLSANTRFSHGRLIGASEASEIGLNVVEFGRDDPTWAAYWELYVRAEVYMQLLGEVRGGPVAKLFFDRASTLPAY